MTSKIINKKDFSGWLVVSDVDGTLNSKLRRLPKNNYDAIKRFVEELKGNFTLASGRSVTSIERHYRALPLNDIPVVILNGSGIYDFKSSKMIWFSGIGENGKKLVGDVLKKFPKIEIEICSPDHIYLINPLIFSPAVVNADNLPHSTIKSPDEISELEWGKVIFYARTSVLAQVRKYIATLSGIKENFMSTSIVSYEMVAEGVHKGTAVLKLADLLGIDHNKTAAIGDYFNDYDMLKSVYLPAVCKQAPAKMHEIAKYHAVHCNKGAVADFLNHIEKTY